MQYNRKLEISYILKNTPIKRKDQHHNRILFKDLE